MAALALLTGYELLLGPWVQSQHGQGWATVGSLVVRFGALLGFCALLAGRFEYSRMGVARWGTLIAFLDQVVIKGAWVAHDLQVNAAAWEGLTLREAIVGLGMTYVMFLPVTLLLCLAAREVGVALAGRRVQPPVQ